MCPQIIIDRNVFPKSAVTRVPLTARSNKGFEQFNNALLCASGLRLRVAPQYRPHLISQVNEIVFDPLLDTYLGNTEPTR